MVSARDAYDDWYDDDEPYAEPRARRYEEETPRDRSRSSARRRSPSS